jgi:flagellar P-ring protein precursor FlgI
MKSTTTVLLTLLSVATALLWTTPAEGQTDTAQKHAKAGVVFLPAGSQAATGAQSDTAATGLVRIKDIADVQGARGNQLIGYGLVVGLEGTGDGQSAQFTPATIANMLRRLNVSVPLSQITVKNVAAVMVTADLPPFVKPGSKIDVLVSSLGDAKSLQGGTLLQSVLYGANNEPYAVAQGALSIGGFNFASGGSQVQKNHVNVGQIPRGAYVEQEVPMTLTDGNTLQITLREPDFTTANRAAAAIRRQLPGVGAQAIDAATITVTIPADKVTDTISFISQVETVRVTPDAQARIVINERTGTVAITGHVRLAEGAVAQGSIHVQVTNTPVVVAAPNFSKNAPPPLVVPQKDTQATESGGHLAAIPPTTTLDQLVHALNALGVTPHDLLSILQAMHRAGMVNADIEVQ